MTNWPWTKNCHFDQLTKYAAQSTANMDHNYMMYQIRLRFYGAWQLATVQRGGGPQLINHPVSVYWIFMDTFLNVAESTLDLNMGIL